jgi:MFS family permease
MGFVSLFADMTYEGARSITGPYLATFGANAAFVGLVAGFAEFVGYSVRLFSGFWATKTSRHLVFNTSGYIINLIAVPLLALTSHWQTAALLIIIERVGKALRIPAKDAMLSHAGQSIGMGWAFGVHRFLDQIGAVLGPLLIAFVVFFSGQYRFSFALLAIPALIALIILSVANRHYRSPNIIPTQESLMQSYKITPAFWYFLGGSSLIALGYAHFAIIAYHFQKTSLLTPAEIPIAYALAMGFEGAISPICGRLYDRKGFTVFIIVALLNPVFAPLIFLGGPLVSFCGVALWGMSLGAQGALMKAIIGDLVPPHKRTTAYGIFNMIYGFFWFLGSVSIGLLYDRSIPLLIFFITMLQLLSLPLLYLAKKKLEIKNTY